MKTLKHTFALLLLAISLSSCAMLFETEARTKEILMTVEEGMTQQQIMTLLGTPKYRRFNNRLEEWEYLRYATVVIVYFDDGRVTGLDSFPYVNSVPATLPMEVTVAPVTSSSYPELSDRRRMNDAEFDQLYATVKRTAFKSDQLKVLDAEIGRRRISSRQCAQMMNIYTFDDDKLKVLDILSTHIADRENYEEITHALSFLSNQKKAMEMLGFK